MVCVSPLKNQKAVLKNRKKKKETTAADPSVGDAGASKTRQTPSSRFEKAQHALTNDQIPVSPLQLRLPALAHRRRRGRPGAATTIANGRRAARVARRGLLRLPDLVRGRRVRWAGGRAEGMRVLV